MVWALRSRCITAGEPGCMIPNEIDLLRHSNNVAMVTYMIQTDRTRDPHESIQIEILPLQNHRPIMTKRQHFKDSFFCAGNPGNYQGIDTPLLLSKLTQLHRNRTSIHLHPSPNLPITSKPYIDTPPSLSKLTNHIESAHRYTDITPQTYQLHQNHNIKIYQGLLLLEGNHVLCD